MENAIPLREALPVGLVIIFTEMLLSKRSRKLIDTGHGTRSASISPHGTTGSEV